MVWDYRVIKNEDENESWYQIHEVYYHKDGKIKCISKDPMNPFGNTMHELKQDMRYMRLACRRPYLKMKDLDEYFNSTEKRDWDE